VYCVNDGAVMGAWATAMNIAGRVSHSTTSQLRLSRI